MDGTFGGGDLISASLAIMLGGGTDAELHDKEVTLTTSDVTGSQTAIFEYDPQNEPTTGTPPGPWDGYSLFTIDLSGVKDDIEDLQQQVSDLEDCRNAVIDKFQEYDPDFNPQTCQDIVNKVGEDEDELENLQEEVEACHDCKDAVIAAIQQYVPSFTPDPTTCNIPDGVDDVYDQGREDEAEENPPGFDLPEGVNITDILPFLDKDDIVTPEGNSYSFNYYVFEDIEQKRYPVNYKFEPMVEGKRFQLQGFCEIIDNATGTVVETPGITGTIDISSNRDVSWQIIKNEIDYTAKELVTTTHFREGTYEDDWVTRNNILLYLDTASPNPRYNVRNG